ncbi:MAG TPA: HTTM domain-containing protein [Vicinamibacteria bacterium]
MNGAGAWARFWHGQESGRNLAAARILLAGCALWVVLSRAELPSLLAFPAEMWAGVSPERRWRFGLVLGLGAERVLFGLLHVTLLGALLGVLPRLSCLLSGLLLYHFAPLETLIRTPNPYLRGLTLPTLGLLVLAAAPCLGGLTLWPRRGADDAVPAWPLRLVQVLVCAIYFFAGYAKLWQSGPGWAAADNMRRYLLSLNQGLAADPPATLGYAVAASPLACALIGVGGLLFELAFPLVLCWRRLRWVWLPLAAAFHLANSLLFRIFFPNVPLLLLFVDWGGRPGPDHD